MIMRLSEKDSMQYLHDRGFSISIQHFYRIKKRIQESRFDRLSLIAKQGFVDQHLERIDQLELINSEYWKLYRETKDTFKKALILEKIAELQTYISPYYDASRYILEKSITKIETEKNSTVPAL
jgi:DNA repair ATPase RecN